MPVRIGFDAKRLFFNRSGLGNYSRSTVRLLSACYPEDEHVLFTPKKGNPLGLSFGPETRVVVPRGGMRLVPSLWRSYGMAPAIRKSGVGIYHGLSNELPADILRAGCRSVLTMHDLIFVHFPELYQPFDRYIYRKKYRASCERADRIIAISLQTKDDLVNVWHIAPEKIDVVYQGCSPLFYGKRTEEEKRAVRGKYGLPPEYILSVGSIEERKNLMLTVEAMAAGRIDLPLVACGRHTPYADRVMECARKNGIDDRVFFYHDVSMEDLPAIYQMARAAVYVSFYEGFGIPIIEALNSGTPMITSRGGVFPETGGDACLYVDPRNVEEMVAALDGALYDDSLRQDLIAKGHAYVKRFGDREVAENLHRVYEKLI